MFFSVTKVLSLCDTLKINFSAEKVMQGIGFLFRNSDKAMGHLKVAIKVTAGFSFNINNLFIHIFIIELSRCYSEQH